MIAEHQSAYRAGGADALVPKPVDWLMLDTEMERLTGGASTAPAATSAPKSAGEPILFDQRLIKELIDALGHDGLAAMVPSFIESVGDYLSAIKKAAKKDSLRDAKRTAHAPKGLSAQFGATQLSELARQVEIDLDSSDAVIALFPQIETVAKATTDAVRDRYCA